LKLPALTLSREQPSLPDVRQITIIGGSAAGKSRFMEELTNINGDRAYCISAISAPFPEREESTRPGSIDVLFAEAARNQPYMRTDAVSELDKLAYMLFVDEFEYLLSVKQEKSAGRKVELKPTRLDRIVELWEKVFPGNRIVRTPGSLMFSTTAGSDLISLEKLSRSEQTVLYYAAAVLYAAHGAVIFVDSPSLFIHPSLLPNLWNAIEELRPDCTFVYNSVDVEFVSSRTSNACIWVKSYDVDARAWDYEVLPPGHLTDELFVDLIGTRKPVLFIEGDLRHSIDARLYPLVFPDCTVRPLGSCDKVIETTRSFNDLRNMHHLESKGIVDRDRRTEQEVSYLRRKSIMVPEVAEVENIFLLEGVIKAMALRRGKNPHLVFEKVKKAVIEEFRRRFDEQALQHVRHRVKREVECKIDARFPCITAMETHLRSLINLLSPRKQYDELRGWFREILDSKDYAAVLKVFNHKPMLGECGIARLLGYGNKDEYITGVLATLKEGGPAAKSIRNSIRYCFRIEDELSSEMPIESAKDEREEVLMNFLSAPQKHKKKKKRKKRHKNKTAPANDATFAS
ncbi:MAG: DUF4435 domain-containing protein, partial [Muribaculaceae bacterium]|nr:DUF4435 domain-containing protein [Muribaculaceae bacterium]